jgi:futalosine hydrolase
MSFKILYVTATSSEARLLNEIRGIMSVSEGFCFGNIEISLLVAGVGSISTAWALKQWVSVNGKPDMALNAGIAGSYKDEYAIGDVVMPMSDCFADAGIEDNEKFLTLAEAGLVNADEFPFRGGLLFADNSYLVQMKSLIKPVRAITVNTATGTEMTREKLVNKFNPDIETMEGATFFYICTKEKIPFLALRAISNMVEPRDKRKWDIGRALDSLTEKVEEVFIRLE